MPIPLDDRRIRALQPPSAGRLELRDSKVRGLILRVTSAGVKTFALWYRANGTARRLTLGEYKSDGVRGAGITLAEAREQAERRLAEIRLGADPAAAKVAARHSAGEGVLTVEALATRCLEALPLRPKTAREWGRLARKEIIGSLGRWPVAELTRGEVRRWMQDIADRPAPYTANRAFEVLRRIFSWGVEQDLVVGSPFVGLKRPAMEERSERVLSAGEIRSVLTALTQTDLSSPAYSDAVRLLFLTGVRRDMVQGMRRSELEGWGAADPRWVIPGGFQGRSKSGRAHVVPLSPRAVQVVERRMAVTTGDLLFPVQRTGPLNARGEAAMSWTSRFVRELKSATEEAHGAAVPRWTIHNIRHTVGTHMREDLKVPREIVSLILGHTQAGPTATRIYDRSELLPERRAALIAWSEWLARIVRDDGRKPRVVPLVRSSDRRR
jgi:integrase